jgi:hypothetical protein
MSTRCRGVYVLSTPSMELLRVVVLDSGPVKGDTVNELTENQTLLLKIHLYGQGRLQV